MFNDDYEYCAAKGCLCGVREGCDYCGTHIEMMAEESAIKNGLFCTSCDTVQPYTIADNEYGELPKHCKQCKQKQKNLNHLLNRGEDQCQIM